MNKKKSAIQWLKHAYWENEEMISDKHLEIALQMEREQIEDAFKEGQYNGNMYEERGFDTITSNKFYEQKYGGKSR